MDELAKRREARRRKILENSQNRLSRITGIQDKATRDCVGPIHVQHHVDQLETDYLGQESVHEATPQQTKTSTAQKHSPQIVRTVVISALAVFINLLVVFLNTFLDLPVTNIFLPLIVYEVSELITSNKQPTGKKNFVYLLLLANAKNRNVVSALKYGEIVASLMQDVMIYFFVYGCCDFVKYSLRVLS